MQTCWPVPMTAQSLSTPTSAVRCPHTAKLSAHRGSTEASRSVGAATTAPQKNGPAGCSFVHPPGLRDRNRSLRQCRRGDRRWGLCDGTKVCVTTGVATTSKRTFDHFEQLLWDERSVHMPRFSYGPPAAGSRCLNRLRPPSYVRASFNFDLRSGADVRRLSRAPIGKTANHPLANNPTAAAK